MIYAVYLAYSKWQVLPDELCKDEKTPSYPKEFRNVCMCKDQSQQLYVYSETPCPASICLEAETAEEMKNKIEEMNSNFDNEDWLKENIYPFI